MVIISVPARHHEADHHWDNKDGHGVERVDHDERRQEGDVQRRHYNKYPADLGMFCALTKCAEITRYREPPRILVPRHYAAIWRAPSGLVFRLIHIVIMMAEIVMQDPDV